MGAKPKYYVEGKKTEKNVAHGSSSAKVSIRWHANPDHNGQYGRAKKKHRCKF
jgi:hypothetical protein